ncbi:hypothetical protein [Acrocarpospora sp. B8E8]
MSGALVVLTAVFLMPLGAAASAIALAAIADDLGTGPVGLQRALRN